MLALAYALKPVIVGVRAMWTLEPLVDEHVCSIVVEFLAQELAHREAGWDELGVVPPGHTGRQGYGRVFVKGDGERANDVERMQVEVGVKSERRRK